MATSQDIQNLTTAIQGLTSQMKGMKLTGGLGSSDITASIESSFSKLTDYTLKTKDVQLEKMFGSSSAWYQRDEKKVSSLDSIKTALTEFKTTVSSWDIASMGNDIYYMAKDVKSILSKMGADTPKGSPAGNSYSALPTDIGIIKSTLSAININVSSILQALSPVLLNAQNGQQAGILPSVVMMPFTAYFQDSYQYHQTMTFLTRNMEYNLRMLTTWAMDNKGSLLNSPSDAEATKAEGALEDLDRSARKASKSLDDTSKNLDDMGKSWEKWKNKGEKFWHWLDKNFATGFFDLFKKLTPVGEVFGMIPTYFKSMLDYQNMLVNQNIRGDIEREQEKLKQVQAVSDAKISTVMADYGVSLEQALGMIYDETMKLQQMPYIYQKWYERVEHYEKQALHLLSSTGLRADLVSGMASVLEKWEDYEKLGIDLKGSDFIKTGSKIYEGISDVVDAVGKSYKQVRDTMNASLQSVSTQFNQNFANYYAITSPNQEEYIKSSTSMIKALGELDSSIVDSNKLLNDINSNRDKTASDYFSTEFGKMLIMNTSDPWGVKDMFDSRNDQDLLEGIRMLKEGIRENFAGFTPETARGEEFYTMLAAYGIKDADLVRQILREDVTDKDLQKYMKDKENDRLESQIKIWRTEYKRNWDKQNIFIDASKQKLLDLSEDFKKEDFIGKWEEMYRNATQWGFDQSKKNDEEIYGRVLGKYFGNNFKDKLTSFATGLMTLAISGVMILNNLAQMIGKVWTNLVKFGWEALKPGTEANNRLAWDLRGEAKWIVENGKDFEKALTNTLIAARDSLFEGLAGSARAVEKSISQPKQEGKAPLVRAVDTRGYTTTSDLVEGSGSVQQQSNLPAGPTPSQSSVQPQSSSQGSPASSAQRTSARTEALTEGHAEGAIYQDQVYQTFDYWARRSQEEFEDKERMRREEYVPLPRKEFSWSPFYQGGKGEKRGELVGAVLGLPFGAKGSAIGSYSLGMLGRYGDHMLGEDASQTVMTAGGVLTAGGYLWRKGGLKAIPGLLSKTANAWPGLTTATAGTATEATLGMTEATLGTSGATVASGAQQTGELVISSAYRDSMIKSAEERFIKQGFSQSARSLATAEVDSLLKKQGIKVVSGQAAKASLKTGAEAIGKTGVNSISKLALKPLLSLADGLWVWQLGSIIERQLGFGEAIHDTLKYGDWKGVGGIDLDKQGLFTSLNAENWLFKPYFDKGEDEQLAKLRKDNKQYQEASDRLEAISEKTESKKKFVEKFMEEKLKSLPSGIDTSLFKEDALLNHRENLLESWEISNHEGRLSRKTRDGRILRRVPTVSDSNGSIVSGSPSVQQSVTEGKSDMALVSQPTGTWTMVSMDSLQNLNQTVTANAQEMRATQPIQLTSQALTSDEEEQKRQNKETANATINTEKAVKSSENTHKALASKSNQIAKQQGDATREQIGFANAYLKRLDKQSAKIEDMVMPAIIFFNKFNNNLAGQMNTYLSGMIKLIEEQANVSSEEITEESTGTGGQGGGTFRGYRGGSVFNAPITGNYMENRGNHYHNGVDFGAPGGTPLPATEKAVVADVEHNPALGGGYGKLVFLKGLESGMYIGYAHLSEVNTRIGDTVSPGEMIGRVGNTGHSFGDHLHFMVGTNVGFPASDVHSTVNPLDYLAGKDIHVKAIKKSAKSPLIAKGKKGTKGAPMVTGSLSRLPGFGWVGQKGSFTPAFGNSLVKLVSESESAGALDAVRDSWDKGYGKYQLTVTDQFDNWSPFVRWLGTIPEYRDLYERLKSTNGYQPSTVKPAMTYLAKHYRNLWEKAQDQYIVKNYLDTLGQKVNSRGIPFRSAALSFSVLHGVQGASDALKHSGALATSDDKQALVKLYRYALARLSGGGYTGRYTREAQRLGIYEELMAGNRKGGGDPEGRKNGILYNLFEPFRSKESALNIFSALLPLDMQGISPFANGPMASGSWQEDNSQYTPVTIEANTYTPDAMHLADYDTVWNGKSMASLPTTVSETASLNMPSNDIVPDNTAYAMGQTVNRAWGRQHRSQIPIDPARYGLKSGASVVGASKDDPFLKDLSNRGEWWSKNDRSRKGRLVKKGNSLVYTEVAEKKEEAKPAAEAKDKDTAQAKPATKKPASEATPKPHTAPKAKPQKAQPSPASQELVQEQKKTRDIISTTSARQLQMGERGLAYYEKVSDTLGDIRNLMVAQIQTNLETQEAVAMMALGNSGRPNSIGHFG